MHKKQMNANNYVQEKYLLSSSTMMMSAVSGSIDARSGGMGRGKLRLAVRLSLISNMLSSIKGSWKVMFLTSDEKM
jgi:hypothetical protein